MSTESKPCAFVGGPLDGLRGDDFAPSRSCVFEIGYEYIKYRAEGSEIWHLYQPVCMVYGSGSIYRYVGVVEEAKK